MEDLVFSLSDLFSYSPSLGSVADQPLPLSSVFSGFGALILGKFTGDMGGMTLPVNFSALFIGASISGWLLHGIDLPIDRTIQQPMLVSMIGMVLAAAAMMWWMQNERQKV